MRLLLTGAALFTGSLASAAEPWPGPLVAAGTISRPSSLPAGGFGPVFTLQQGRLAVWQARDWGRVAVFDLPAGGSPILRSVINAPDSTYDNPSFGAKLAFSGPDRLFIGNPFTWVSAPHDGLIYSYAMGGTTPQLVYRQAQNPHSAGYFGWEVSIAGDVLVSGQGANGGSWQTRSATFFYRLNPDLTLTLVGEEPRGDFTILNGAAISGDYVAVVYSQGLAGPGELRVSRMRRENGQITGITTAPALTLPASSIDLPRAQPSGGSAFFRVAAAGPLIAVAHHGADASAADNSVTLYRVQETGGGFSVSSTAVIPAPLGASPSWGRRVAFAWGHLLVSDPRADRPGLPAQGLVHVYRVDDPTRPELVAALGSARTDVPGAFGDFLAFDATTGPRGVLAVGRRTAPGDLAADHEIELLAAPDTVAPTFTLQPTGLTVPAGTLVSLSVAASGRPEPSYQWYRDGLPLPGETAAVLSLPTVQPGEAGTYHAVARNAGGSATSAAAVLTIMRPESAPRVIQATGDLEPAAGTEVVLQVEAAGSPPLLYQWLRNGNALEGQTSATLRLPSFGSAQTGLYACRITNSLGSVQSLPARVSLPPAAAAVRARLGPGAPTTYPSAGGELRVPVLLSYPGRTPSALGFTLNVPDGWTFLGVEGTHLPEITPATGNRLSLDFAFTQPPPDAAFYVVVLSVAAGTDGLQTLQGGGTFRSPLQELTVEPVSLLPSGAPVVAQGPATRAAVVGASVVFTVVAHSAGGLSYQWRRDGVALAGATQPSLVLANVQPAQAGAYTVVVTNAAGETIPPAADLIVVEARATHAVTGSAYQPGGEVTVTHTLTHAAGSGPFAWQVLLPAGWAFVGAAGDQASQRPTAGTQDLLEWTWNGPPPSPLSFTYGVRIPVTATGDQQLASLVHLRHLGHPVRFLAAPDPLRLTVVSHHTADVNRDFRVSLLELTRVIELFNTRHAGARTGAYREDLAGEDGYAPAPELSLTGLASPTRFHAADVNRDARITLLELTRVIELFNFREAGVRTGRYRILAGTEDGFAAGP
jgi:hypothetical protein